MVDPQVIQSEVVATQVTSVPDSGADLLVGQSADLAMLAALVCAAPVAKVLLPVADPPMELASYGQFDTGMHTMAELSLPFPLGPVQARLQVCGTRPDRLTPDQEAALAALVRLVAPRGVDRVGVSAPVQEVEPDQAAFERRLQEEWVRHGLRKEALGLLLISVGRGLEAPGYRPESGAPQDTEAVERLIGACLRSSDFLVELSEGQWAVLLASSGLNATMVAAQRIRQVLDRSSREAKSSWLFHMGAAAMIPVSGVEARQLEERAKHALVQARRGGSGRIDVFHGW